MSEKHTPGPWDWLNYPDGRKLLVGPNRGVIHCPDAPITILPEDQSLIAAAPDLLEACRGLLMCSLPHDISGQRYIDDARAAIAKATSSHPHG